MSDKIIGYRNMTPGDETTDCVPTTTLSTQEQSIARSREAIVELVEILRERLEDAEAKLSALRKACTHHVFKDEAGFPYGLRTCQLCGAHMGSV